MNTWTYQLIAVYIFCHPCTGVLYLVFCAWGNLKRSDSRSDSSIQDSVVYCYSGTVMWNMLLYRNQNTRSSSSSSFFFFLLLLLFFFFSFLLLLLLLFFFFFSSSFLLLLLLRLFTLPQSRT